MAGGIVGPLENPAAEEESERAEASQGEGEVSPMLCKIAFKAPTELSSESSRLDLCTYI